MNTQVNAVLFAALVSVATGANAYNCKTTMESVVQAQTNRQQQYAKPVDVAPPTQPAVRDLSCSAQINQIFSTDVSGSVGSAAGSLGVPLPASVVHAINNQIQARATSYACNQAQQAQNLFNQTVDRGVGTVYDTLPTVPSYIPGH